MTYVTKQLDGEVGIQYRGVEDKTNLQQPGGTGNLLMIVENIPRGRIDQAMTINPANLSAMLGREAGNLYLQAVQDALNTGVPSVNVMRVNTTEETECTPNSIFVMNRPLDNGQNTVVLLTLKIKRGSSPVQTKVLDLLRPDFGSSREFFSQFMLDADIGAVSGGGGLGNFQTFSGSLYGGDGSIANGERIDVEIVPTDLNIIDQYSQALDLYGFLFDFDDQATSYVIHSCGFQNFLGT